ncbi:hypothetical protein [Clostridium acetobutylicum]|uniref:hypothetical protein n=1 Tax=Clostridium acetobutylicum TaxID=1488 RepID=UPI001F4BF860|nr:hypothetical protein [Clostridium acetobutylicum]NRY58843.1 hypothetical protein [Clostridium acetobutylicum]
MPRKKLPCFVGLPYKDHKQRVQLTKKYLKDYYVSDLGGVLYMERRHPNGYKDVIKSLDLKEIVCMWLGIMAL